MEVLDNKQYKTFNQFSRYQNVPYYFHRIDKKYVSGTTTHIDKNTPFILYKTKLNDNLDTIALSFYNNPTYYWIIADFNNIQNPFTTFGIDEELKIPIFNEITFKGTI